MDKTIKKAIIAACSGALCILLSFVVLSGSTYALFQDDASANNNIAKAGILTADLLKYSEAENDYISISDGSGNLFSESRINPGTINITYLAIRNDGNVNIEYEIVTNVQCNNSEDVNIADVIQYAVIDDIDRETPLPNNWDDLSSEYAFFNLGAAMRESAETVKTPESATVREMSRNTIAAEEDNIRYVAIVIYMEESPGLEYMNKTISMDLFIMSSQISEQP